MASFEEIEETRRRPSLRGALLGLGLGLGLLIVACGGRSEIADGALFGGSGVDDPEREGSCDNPIELPFRPQIVRGRLLGPGSAEGWCGADDRDGGREDTYRLVPPYSTDVILTLREGTDFPALLRVTADACLPEEGPDEGALPEICVAPEIDEARHFWAEAGREYYISVDSPAGTDGRYELEVVLGWPPLEACAIHPTTISQASGFFRWENELGSGQGRVTGACGGPGRENMFPLLITEPGTAVIAALTPRNLDAVLSLRTSCAAASELTCEGGRGGEGGALELVYRFEEAGEYYLVVDQADVSGGSYILEVSFL